MKMALLRLLARAIYRARLRRREAQVARSGLAGVVRWPNGDVTPIPR